jgi:hypothetical protein
MLRQPIGTNEKACRGTSLADWNEWRSNAL